MSLVPVIGLFETHLSVRNLDASIEFYRDVIGLEVADVLPERQVAFFWIGASRGAMLGVWETGSSPNAMRLHFAFSVTLADMLLAPERLTARGLQPLGINGEPVDEPVVIGWMPAVSLYFTDPDGHLLEYITVLDETPRPEAGVVPYSKWISGE